jgi:hypothetical protein
MIIKDDKEKRMGWAYGNDNKSSREHLLERPTIGVALSVNRRTFPLG